MAVVPPTPTRTLRRRGGQKAARSTRTDALGQDPLRRIVTSRRDKLLIQVLLVLMAAIFCLPLASGIARSLEVDGIGNYITLLTEPIGGITIWETYFHSLVTGVMHAAIVLVVASMAGYAFSQLDFAGREAVFSAVLLFLAVPAIAILVPVYNITQQAGLFNTHIGVALPEAALTIPFGVLLMRNYGRNLPPALTEAAHLDGAGHFRVFWHIFLPLCRPALANLAVLCIVWSLQDFLWPAFIFTDPSMATAAQAVQTFSNALGQSPAELARYNASLILLAVPAVLFVLFGQRLIVNGLVAGGTKD